MKIALKPIKINKICDEVREGYRDVTNMRKTMREGMNQYEEVQLPEEGQFTQPLLKLTLIE